MVTVSINNRTSRGKRLVELLKELSKTGNDISFADTPNYETIHAIKEAEKRKGGKASNVDDLFDQLNS